MVTDSRAPHDDRHVRPLNLPRPVVVRVDPQGQPVEIEQPGKAPRPVGAIIERWRVDDEWWRERPISRLYWQCATADGELITVFHDLVDDSWWQQRA